MSIDNERYDVYAAAALQGILASGKLDFKTPGAIAFIRDLACTYASYMVSGSAEDAE